MATVNAKEMLLKAAREGYAVGAFNVTSIVQMRAVVDAAVRKGSPLIVQTSVKPSQFLGPRVIVAAFRALADEAPIPLCLHLDHCTDVDYCKRCADLGYTNIMIDASKAPFEENVRKTRAGDITVEGELGTISGVEDQVAVVENEAALCSPEQALRFIEETGVDLFAPAIGTAHGVYKVDNPRIDLARLRRVQELVNAGSIRTPLVIHGGTGLKPDMVKQLVSHGGAKFNVSTELKYLLIDTTRSYIASHPEEYDPGKIDAAVKAATAAAIESWIDLLGCAGKA
jgi:ketose-bisphosphate aldolase